MRTIGGIPVTTWALGVIAGVIGFVWMRNRTKAGAGGQAPGGQPSFTQQQEVQDFQIFSALTGAQQASDLNFLGEVASLFAGGGSPTTNAPSTSPPSTGTAPPTTQGLTNQELANIGAAESQAEVKAAGGNPLVALSNLGLNQSQVQQLGAAAAQPGGATFLEQNMAAEQAGMPYYNSSGQLVG